MAAYQLSVHNGNVSSVWDDVFEKPTDALSRVAELSRITDGFAGIVKVTCFDQHTEVVQWILTIE